MTERRLSTPLVLAAASLMASVGVIGAWRGGLFGTSDSAPTAEAAPVNSRKPRSPEGTAEAFLDAWRKRDFVVAAALSTASAKDAVLAKQADQQGLSDADRVAAEKVWSILAADRLRFLPNESENLPGGALAVQAPCDDRPRGGRPCGGQRRRHEPAALSPWRAVVIETSCPARTKSLHVRSAWKNGRSGCPSIRSVLLTRGSHASSMCSRSARPRRVSSPSASCSTSSKRA